MQTFSYLQLATSLLYLGSMLLQHHRLNQSRLWQRFIWCASLCWLGNTVLSSIFTLVTGGDLSFRCLVIGRLQYSWGSSILKLFNFRQYIKIFIVVKSLNYTLEYSMQAGSAKASDLFPHNLIWYGFFVVHISLHQRKLMIKLSIR
jgi:hypothetical protein